MNIAHRFTPLVTWRATGPDVAVQGLLPVPKTRRSTVLYHTIEAISRIR